MDSLRKWFAPLLIAALSSIQGCGGGGGGGGGGGTAAPAAAPASSVASAPNVQSISVNAGLGGSVNQVFLSVTLCSPGSSVNCQTIDNVILDTGSSGLRILSSALAASLALPQQNDASGNPVVGCGQFADGFTWGPVKLADLKISGEQASSLPIQVIGDPGFASIPRACSATGPSKNTVQNLRANGILGAGVFRQDCGAACAQSASRGLYYVCPTSGCQAAAMPVNKQLQNPVAMFAADNNGVIVVLPAVPDAGAVSVSGALVFGIGTQSNNALGGASVIALSPTSGRFTTVYNGSTYSSSFVDSGSNGLFFQDASIPICTNASTAGFYCPLSTKNASATIQGSNGSSVAVNFSIGNATSLLTINPTFAAFGNVGAPQFVANSFDWGIPFFYGRNIFSAIEGASTPGGTGPYIAF